MGTDPKQVIDFADPKLWVPLVGGTAAWIAAVVAWVNAGRARRTLELQEAQEARRLPQVVIHFERGYIRRTAEARVYALLISIVNRSDSNNSVSRLDLRIRYRTPEHYLAEVEVPALNAPTYVGEGEATQIIQAAGVDAHKTLAGWVYVEVADEMLRGNPIDGYRLVITDAHGIESSIEPIILQEVVDENRA